MTETTKPEPISEARVLCPSCGASDNNPYIDGRGIAMRACGRCMIQWQDQSLPAPPAPRTEEK